MSSETGSEQIVFNLNAIRERLVKQSLAKAVRKGGRIIAAEMIERTPVLAYTNAGSDSLEPGEMKENIKVKGVTLDGNPGALVGPIGKDTRVGHAAHNVEYGHRIVSGGQSNVIWGGVLAGKRNPDGTRGPLGKWHEEDVPPHPIFRPAFEATKAEAFQAVAASLAQDLKEIG